MKKEIIEILQSISDQNLENIELENVDLIEFNILDSMKILYFIAEVEEKFNIEIDSSDIGNGNFKTINSILNLINSKKN